MGGCNFENILSINVPKCYRGVYHVYYRKLSNSSELHYLEPGLYLSLTDIDETMNKFNRERHNHSESCITVGVSRRKRKFGNCHANEESGLAFSNTASGHIFGTNLGNGIAQILGGKWTHKPEVAHNFVRIRSFMIYTDLIEYNKVCDTKPPSLRCFSFVSKLRDRDVLTTGQ